MRLPLFLLLLVGCSNAPERTRIDAASVTTGPSGGLEAAIGIAAGSRLVPVLAAECHLPCSATQVIRPASADQQVIAFQLYQGTEVDLAHGKRPGTYRVSWAGLTRAPAEVEVTFVAESEGAFLHGRARPGGEPLQITRISP